MTLHTKDREVLSVVTDIQAGVALLGSMRATDVAYMHNQLLVRSPDYREIMGMTGCRVGVLIMNTPDAVADVLLRLAGNIRGIVDSEYSGRNGLLQSVLRVIHNNFGTPAVYLSVDPNDDVPALREERRDLVESTVRRDSRMFRSVYISLAAFMKVRDKTPLALFDADRLDQAAKTGSVIPDELIAAHQLGLQAPPVQGTIDGSPPAEGGSVQVEGGIFPAEATEGGDDDGER